MAKTKKEKPVFPDIIDINNQEQLKYLNLDGMIKDASARGDVEALTWLLEQNTLTEKRTATKKGVKGAGKSFTVGKSVLVIRKEYLTNYLGWQPLKETVPAEPSFEEKQAAREKAIKEAMAKAAAAAVAANNAKKK